MENLLLLSSSLNLRPVLLQLGIGSVESRHPLCRDAGGADGAVLNALSTVGARWQLVLLSSLTSWRPTSCRNRHPQKRRG